MRSFFIVIACLVASGVASAQASRIVVTGDVNKDEATIRGHAIYDDTEKPVRRVGVALINTERATALRRITVTDGKGDFIFKNVASGTYRVAVDFGGHTNGYPTNEIERTEGVEVSVDGSSTVDLKIRAIRGASITGRVTYPDGEPVIGAQVNVFRKVRNQWVHPAVVTAGTETDDRGIFRLYPLRAGEYAISVTEQSLSIQERDGIRMQTVESNSLNPYFYQDAVDLKNATIIQVDAGRETSNINLTLTERPTYEVSGTLTGNDKPLASTYLRLNSHSDSFGGPTLTRAYGLATTTDKDGNWLFKGVPDGTYDVEVDTTLSSRESPQAPFERFIAQRQVITVAGSDLAGITINLTEAGRISGKVVMEGGKPLPKQLGVSSELISATSPYHVSRSVDLDAGGNFMMFGVAPGENVLSFSCGTDCYTKSIMVRGRDVLRQPIKVESGAEVSGVTVVLSMEVATLTGRVISGKDNKPLAGIAFALVSTDETKWIGRGFTWASGATGGSGAFKISAPPGDYYFLTIIDPSSITPGVESLKDLTRKSPRVSLKASITNETEIVIP